MPCRHCWLPINCRHCRMGHKPTYKQLVYQHQTTFIYTTKLDICTRLDCPVHSNWHQWRLTVPSSQNITTTYLSITLVFYSATVQLLLVILVFRFSTNTLGLCRYYCAMDQHYLYHYLLLPRKITSYIPVGTLLDMDLLCCSLKRSNLVFELTATHLKSALNKLLGFYPAHMSYKH